MYASNLIKVTKFRNSLESEPKMLLCRKENLMLPIDRFSKMAGRISYRRDCNSCRSKIDYSRKKSKPSIQYQLQNIQNIQNRKSQMESQRG